jgi:dihydropteroate synthase
MRVRLGSVEHDLTTRTLVMGVLEPSPAAFAGDATGAGRSLQDAVTRAAEVVEEGADLLDLGGVGSGVGEEEELERVVAVVEAVRARIDVPLVVDTWRSQVLAAACAAGAVVGSDRSGFADPTYLSVAADAGATVVATHTRLRTGTDVVVDVRVFLAGRVDRARQAGIPDERMIVDGGLDIGKSAAQSLTLLRESAALADLGPPLLLSASNKRFLGTLLDLEVDERRAASHAASALGISRGCRIVRAHDVRGARRVADVLAAVLSARLVQVGRSWAAGDGDG